MIARIWKQRCGEILESLELISEVVGIGQLSDELSKAVKLVVSDYQQRVTVG
jgi:hypothetical protein